MATNPFQSALSAVLSPLEFASLHGFSNAEKIANLDEVVAGVLERVGGFAIPADVRQMLGELREDFLGSEAGPVRDKELARLLSSLRLLMDDTWADDVLGRPSNVLPGVGPRRRELLSKRGLHTVGDLLFLLPRRYEDRSRLTRISDLEVGRPASFRGRVLSSGFSHNQRGRRAVRRFEAVVGDESGTVVLKWFRGGDAISRLLVPDAHVFAMGNVTRYRFSLEMVHPEVEVVEEAEALPTGRDALIPRYPELDGFSQRAVRRLVASAVEEYADLIPGHLPEDVVRSHDLPSAASALKQLHHPETSSDVAALNEGRHGARVRLVLEELFLLELGLQLRHSSQKENCAAPVVSGFVRAQRAEAGLPFALTRAQQTAWAEIRSDLSLATPMSRLLEGDVGCGKTVIAFLAAVAVSGSGGQTALMAPTELLAEQHARTLRDLARTTEGENAIRVALLTSSLGQARVNAVRGELAAGSVDVVVGTHALVQEGVRFRRLMLAITDEQHRFGVKQRAALALRSDRGESVEQPHSLVMTATPIPRTLALTLHGDLDLSVIDELPPGRNPVRTLLVRPREAKRASELLRETVDRGEQVYVVYPLIEASETLDLRAAEDSALKISRAFPDVRVELIHGRLTTAERVQVMARFQSGETQVLVSTTLIEVGIDIPLATLMVVEHAERFGLAQLHQLRGRVGRGEIPGTCLLVARGSTADSEARLSALMRSTDGFEIAEADLRIRGPGEFLGSRQHGFMPDLLIADLLRDARHVQTARDAARSTLESDPVLRSSPGLLKAVKARWGERLDLAGVG
ncbi:ATP-dependent DNA helicase RecG [Myxococcota bacterium]|nr:ATP-dependent DNA helicase RecG [Myxococcota bacterium]